MNGPQGLADMVGYLRYLLASLVLYSHLNYPLWNVGGVAINQGVYAVFCFYLISGFFTAVIFERFEGDGQILKFYVDRLLRIMPAFVVVMLLVILINLVWYEPALKASASDYRRPVNWFLGIIQPLNGIIAFFYKGDFPFGPFISFTPVPSLALEVQYFFVFPLLALLPPRLIAAAVLAIVVMVAAAAFRSNPELLENYTYRYLIGVGPTFLLGFLFYRELRCPAPFWMRFDVLGGVAGVIFFCALFIAKPASTVWLGEMALALLTCPLLLRLAMKTKSGSFDQLAGYVSYGVFLAHIPILRFLHLHGESYYEFAIALAVATAVALFIHFLVEKPVLVRRHQIAGMGMRSPIQV